MESIRVLMTKEEKEMIKKAAKKEKRSMSAFMLKTALDKIKEGKK